ncbi:MAG: 4-hydroxythreonine-4-phosphate dehydrogenase PdxA [Syntrophobacteraceae bacterium]
MGDPCGVGPEVIVKAFGLPSFSPDGVPFVIGDRLPLERAIDLLGSTATIRPIDDARALHSHEPGVIPLISASRLSPADIPFGRPSQNSCRAVVAFIETAVRIAQEQSTVAVCTCPINKEQLHRNGFPFPGHTEFIRDLTHSEEVVMMLAGPKLRVALATIHESIADVPALLTKDRLRKTILITARSMERDFGLQSPRIAVAGLNPHAGEAGRFGSEEIDIIEPVVREFRATSWQITGPWPPDTLFHRAWSGEFDAVIAMYHDQGLIPVKLAHFNEAVNISLGLPVVRTSVDHGTAYDIAGTGKADPGSMVAAAGLASLITRNRLQFDKNQADGI